MALHTILCITLAACMLTAGTAEGQQTSRKTFSTLMDVQQLWGEDRHDEALTVLDSLAAENENRPYDYAVTQQYIAHTAMLADRMEFVIPALDEALAMPDLPGKLVAELKLFYGQILLGEEEFEEAKRMLEEWYAHASTDDELSVQPAHVFSLGYANYMTGDLPRSEVLLEDALQLSDKINNNWFRVYYQVLFEQRKYAKAEVVLFGLVSREPDNETYWRLLTNHFLQVEESHKALASLAIAELQDLLDDTKDQERLASMYSYVEIPEKAARILEAAIDNEGIDVDAETLRRLGDLWLLARDRSRALDYLTRAAAASPDGRTFELVGSLLFEDEQWQEAHDAYVQALNYGGLEEPERIHLLAGMSAMRAGDKAAARESFNEARKSEEFRSQAVAMLRQLDQS